MSITSQLEKKFGIKIETLNSVEMATYNKMLKAVQKAQIDQVTLKKYVVSMRESVERELIKEPEFKWIFIFRVFNRKQIMLKARLQNYLLWETFLVSPAKAKERLEEMIDGMLPKT